MMHPPSLAVAALMACAPCALAAAQSSCAEYASLAVLAGKAPVDGALADFDLDGDVDVVVLDTDALKLVVFANDGAGRFTILSQTPVGNVAQFRLRGVAAGDLDGDLDPDAVCLVTAPSPAGVEFFSNQGGTLVSTGRIPVTTYPSRPLLADLDQDGDLDLAFAGAPGIHLWSNNGLGQFTAAPDVATSSVPDDLALGDLNGDGRLDIVATRGLAGSSPIFRLLHVAGLSYQQLAQTSHASTLRAIAAGDIDRDGLDDVVVGNSVGQLIVQPSSGGQIVSQVGSFDTCEVYAGDVDGDGFDDIVTDSEGLRLVTWSAGTLIWGPRLAAGGAPGEQLLVADLDGDLDADLLDVEGSRALIVPLLGDGIGNFPSPQLLPVVQTGPAPWYLRSEIVRDLDGDGHVDIVTNGPSASFWRNTGAGSFTAAGGANLGYGPLVAADMNGDGRLDVVRASSVSGEVSIRFQQPGFVFGPPLATPMLNPSVDLDAADADNDGDQDLVVSDSGSVGAVRLLTNVDGLGTLSVTALTPGDLYSNYVRFADVDGDLDQDLLITAVTTSTVPPIPQLSLMRNLGGGVFAAPVVVAGGSPTTAMRCLEVGDLDRDGDIDVVLGASNLLHVWVGNGLGQFTLRDSHVLDRAVVRVAIGRLDGDGAPDLAALEAVGFAGTPAGMSVWRNRGDARFTRQATLTSGVTGERLAILDFDQDGWNEALLMGTIGTLFQSNPDCATGFAICTNATLGGDHTTPCPCGNAGLAGRGCGHSFDAGGAELETKGNTALDDVTLHSRFTPTASFTLFLQHDAAGDQGFHDGVLCAGGNLIRLRGRNAGVPGQPGPGEALYPNPAFAQDTQTLSQRGGVVPGSGVTRYYSAWYRNASTSFCPPATANVTNGWRLAW